MNGLYKRVLKGAYPEIPKKYTKDLADVIMRLLSVESKLRPSCQQILDMPQVRKRMAKLFPDEKYTETSENGMFNIEEENYGSSKNELLNTIKVP
jgi:NIMA (never in mitosis gene a)-related kinase